MSIYQITGKTYYVDGTNGNDVNDGLSLATALAKISTAHAKADAKVILVAEGLYDFTNWVPVTKDISIKALPEASVILSTHVSGLSWALTADQANTYQTARITTVAMRDASIVDEFGDYELLELKTSIDEVEANPGSWFKDATYTYIHASDSRVPDANMRLYNNNYCISHTGNKTIYLEGIELHGGKTALYITNTVAELTPKLYAKNCNFRYGTAGNGIIDSSGSEYNFFQNCIAGRGANDGFNYHAANGILPKVIEVGCIGRHNGITSDTDNGSTIHDGGKIIRVNGQYYSNVGSNVGDIGPGTQSWNLGCIARDSLAVSEDAYKSNFTDHTDAEMWNHLCASYGSLNASTTQDGAEMHSRNSVYDGNRTIEGTGANDSY